MRVNCTDVVLTKMSTPEKLQRVLYCGNRLAACNGQKATNRWDGGSRCSWSLPFLPALCSTGASKCMAQQAASAVHTTVC